MDLLVVGANPDLGEVVSRDEDILNLLDFPPHQGSVEPASWIALYFITRADLQATHRVGAKVINFCTSACNAGSHAVVRPNELVDAERSAIDMPIRHYTAWMWAMHRKGFRHDQLIAISPRACGFVGGPALPHGVQFPPAAGSRAMTCLVTDPGYAGFRDECVALTKEQVYAARQDRDYFFGHLESDKYFAKAHQVFNSAETPRDHAVGIGLLFQAIALLQGGETRSFRGGGLPVKNSKASMQPATKATPARKIGELLALETLRLKFPTSNVCIYPANALADWQLFMDIFVTMDNGDSVKTVDAKFLGVRYCKANTQVGLHYGKRMREELDAVALGGEPGPLEEHEIMLLAWAAGDRPETRV
mmetsp:Transcript_29560/g.95010  ORF Transcript_29560/g.95010 Transcript_29560/m.95010 type:complete len:362 (-) Transcript_29560:4-1089(-)